MGKSENEGDMEGEAAEPDANNAGLDGGHCAARICHLGLEGERVDETVRWRLLVDYMESPRRVHPSLRRERVVGPMAERCWINFD